MKLATWLSSTKASDAEFALRIGVSRQALWRYKCGSRVPRPAIIERIKKATGGKVRPDDFFAPASPSRAPAEAGAL